mgnify:CR=1 FL=1
MVAYSPHLLVANNKMPFNTVPELIAYAKANPNKLSYSTTVAYGTMFGNWLKSTTGVRMEEVRGKLNDTYFAWIGGTAPESVFYYRIHSPMIVIEFDHQTPVGLRWKYDPNKPRPDHIHTVVRTPNGNDYGMDLLRQHYASAGRDHSHHDPHPLARR